MSSEPVAIQAPPNVHVELLPAASIATLSAADWDQLADQAAEPNPFFERWALLPAVEHFAERALSILVVYRDPGDGASRELIALAPVIESRARGLPVKTLSVWRYPECYLATPLIHRNWITPAIVALAQRLSEGSLGRLPDLDPGGVVSRALFDEAGGNGLELGSLARYSRAYCDTATASDAASYLARSISHKHRKELRRQSSRLAELGDVRLEVLRDRAQLDRWLDEFLQLEAGGWKGAAGAALSGNPARERFFRDLCRAAWRAGRLQLQALRLGSHAIAMKCNLLAPPGSFAFKICFDEAYGKYSPGSHLEIFNVEQLYASASTIKWMDSCASRRRWLVDRMWGERRGLETVMVSRSRSLRGALVHALPLVIWLRRYFGRIP